MRIVELSDLDQTRIPTHVAIVMDGNGRWAQRRGLPRTDGHAAGEEALMDTIWGAYEAGIRWLTVYAFSTENWKRPVDEVRFLMNFNERLLLTRRDELHDKNIKMQFIGRRDWRVPNRILRRTSTGARSGPGHGMERAPSIVAGSAKPAFARPLL